MADYGGREKVNVYPARPEAVEPAAADKFNYFAVGNGAGVMNLLVVGEELLAPSAIADQKFPVDVFVCNNPVETEQGIELFRVWLLVLEITNPDRRVDKYHR
jgi:hypothetical protein